MISPVAEGNVGDVKPLGKVWLTRESSQHRAQVLVQQRTGGGGTGSQQELTGQGQSPGSQPSQSSEVETSHLATARRDGLLLGVDAADLVGRAGHHGRPNSQVQPRGGGGRQTLRSEPAGTSGLENFEG